MRRAETPEDIALVARLGAVLTKPPHAADEPDFAVQHALNVVLEHISEVSRREGVAPGVADRLSRRITALQNPLTELLAQRLKTVNPALPSGEAEFVAAADAHVIVSAGLLSIPR